MHLPRTLLAGILLLADFAAAQWTHIKGPDSVTIDALACTGSRIIAGTKKGIFRSDDNGGAWTKVLDGEIKALQPIRNSIFAGAVYDMYRSEDNGTSWSAADAGLNIGTMVTSFTALDNYVFAGIRGLGVYRSADNGGTWVEVNKGLENREVFFLASKGGDIFAGTPWGIFQSTNRGGTWRMQSGLRGIVRAMAVFGSDSYAGVHGSGIYRSKNGTEKWQPVNTGLTELYVFCLAVYDNKLYAGTSGGVFVLPKGSDSWSKVGAEMDKVSVLSLVAGGKSLFAGTYDHGIYRLGGDNPH